MIEVYPNLYVGDAEDYETQVKRLDGWGIVQACKEPYHRAALGYTGRSAPKEHPEYLFAKRGNRLILNLVDAADPAYFSTIIMDCALDFIGDSLQNGLRALVHCNQGRSRSAGIALLYLAARARAVPVTSFEEAEAAFISLYPPYEPSTGMRGFLKLNWSHYCPGRL